jgi:p-aminobenzoyl-glutamate transporter AbgT
MGDSLSDLVPPLMFHLKVVLQNTHKYLEVLDKRRAA